MAGSEPGSVEVRCNHSVNCAQTIAHLDKIMVNLNSEFKIKVI